MKSVMTLMMMMVMIMVRRTMTPRTGACVEFWREDWVERGEQGEEGGEGQQQGGRGGEIPPRDSC